MAINSRVYQPTIFIDQLDLEAYGFNNKNASGNTLFNETQLNYLIDQASTRVRNYIRTHTNNKINITKIEQLNYLFHQDIKEATLATFNMFLQGGVHFSTIKQQIESGSIKVMVDGKPLYVAPQAEISLNVIVQALLEGEINVISTNFIDSENPTSEGIPTYSIILKNIGEDVKVILTEERLKEYLLDIETGEVPNNSGDIWSDTTLEKQTSDTKVIYSKMTMDNKLLGYVQVATLDNYVLKSDFLVSQQNQDAVIAANTAQIAAARNKNNNQDTAIKNLEQAVVSSATDLATYVGSGTPATIGTTPVTLTPTVRKDFLTNTYVGYTSGIWLIKDNINIKLDIIANIARTTFNGPIDVTLRLVDELNVILDTQVVRFDFTNTTVFAQQTSFLSTRFTTVDPLVSATYKSIHLEILTSANTISASNLKIAFGFSTNENASRASTTNDVINVSSVVGSTTTNALDTLDQKNISQDTTINSKASQTDLDNLESRVVELENNSGGSIITDIILIDNILYNDAEVIIIENYLQYYNLNFLTMPGGTQSPYYNYNIIINGYDTKLERLSLSSSGQFYAMTAVNGANLELTLEFPPISGTASTMKISLLGQIKV